jgi:WD40 repeat protein
MTEKPKAQATAPEAAELPSGVKLRHTLKGHQDQVLRVAFDPQGKTLASGSADYTVKLWDVQNGGKPLGTLKGHVNRVL